MSTGIGALPSKHDPSDCLHHIIDNAARIERHLADFTLQTFADSEWARDAVERCLERICEAVIRLGDEAERLMPGQPWSDIRGMGNRLRHAYDHIDVAIVWNTAKSRVPALAALARQALDDLAGC